MTDYEPGRQEGDGSNDNRRGVEAVAKRVSRALDSFFHVEAANDDGKYTVYSGSGNTYTVDLPEGTCTCPDGQRGPWCKHAHRAAFVTGEIPDIDGVHVAVNEQNSDEPAETDGDTLAARVERFEQQNPGASAIEAISQLGINPDQIERVEEVLA